MAPEDDDLPRLLSGRYRLEATLGHGGMGVVYRGLDLMMKRPIAVKLIRAVDGVELDDEIAGRFLREAKNTARIQHEHIIEVFDLGRSDEGGMYFVMELLEGESLSARIRRDGAMSVTKVVHIGRQICEALQVAHTAGIIHRDLKPANVMLLSRAGDPNYVKVLDFGVAKSYAADQETQLTHTGMLVGTVDYMAPEQIMGKTVDGRTDIYALGVVLYKMLSGKAPFRDTGVPALIHAHLNTMPKPLHEVVRDIPGELDRVVLRCLAKNPDRRYESMAELGRALVMSIATDDDARMMSLEYADSTNKDPYAADDKTEIGRVAAPAVASPVVAIPAPPPKKSPFAKPIDDATVAPARAGGGAGGRSYSDPVPDDDSTYNENMDRYVFDDATVKMDRPLDFKKSPSGSAPSNAGGGGGGVGGRGLPMTPRGGLSALRDLGGPPPQPPSRQSPTRIGLPPPSPYADDVSTAKRQIPDEITRIDRTEAKTCAMCQTVNAPHARACVACGVSLASDDQEAVRARVRQTSAPPPPPRTSNAPAPPMAPPVSGAYDMAMRQSSHPSYPSHPSGPYGQPTPSPMHGVPWIPHQQSPSQRPPPTTAWQRFLRWTGLG